ncbi:hypothetical protein E3N88_13212 [Mikania micrantha]|uniref:Leucine-rich repeat-containing N-terminal plant-type domain-containing protein n=1 Tax=Mikania micrantha TaxID=192012 RepID=A0A5N6P844_9ASTR|nr:hypothetical protein E3N88_13212 [Mikania micrantha]
MGEWILGVKHGERGVVLIPREEINHIMRKAGLECLDLSNNKLVGSIPKEISYLSKLVNLVLEDNNLNGGIPPFMVNVTSMQTLIISRNPLRGSIPDNIGHWKNLSHFICTNCNLSGTIPHSLFNLSRLINLTLDDNQLKGSLPPVMMLPNLVFLQLSVNKLTGYLPPSISNCSILNYLELAENKFRGKLTINFAKLRDIKFITLGQNNFGSNDVDEMKFFDSLENCTQLKLLDLRGCNFQGVLPMSIGNLSNQLQYLYLNDNQLHGKLPESIGCLSGLETLLLGSNQFTGNIPSTIEDETAMQNQETHAQIRDKWLASILKIGVSCSMDSPQHRMDMKNVVDELKHILDDVKNI